MGNDEVGAKLSITSHKKMQEFRIDEDVPPADFKRMFGRVADDLESLAEFVRQINGIPDARRALEITLFFAESIRRIAERMQKDKLREMGREG